VRKSLGYIGAKQFYLFVLLFVIKVVAPGPTYPRAGSPSFLILLLRLLHSIQLTPQRPSAEHNNCTGANGASSGQKTRGCIEGEDLAAAGLRRFFSLSTDFFFFAGCSNHRSAQVARLHRLQTVLPPRITTINRRSRSNGRFDPRKLESRIT